MRAIVPPLLVIAGPTGSGKSQLALRVAARLGGEIVSCDSVAVYRGMDVGAAKPTVAERGRVPHHLLDVVDPVEAFTAGEWARQARAAIEEVTARGRLPIVAGGTGFYLRALLEGLFPAPAADPVLRERLRARAARVGPARLHRLLERLDAEAARRIHPNDTPKLLRALEVTVQARGPMTAEWAERGRAGLTGYAVRRVVLQPPRAALRERLDGRALAMIEGGLLEETKGLLERWVPGWRGGAALPRGYEALPRAFGALGYAQAVAVLRGEMTVEAAVQAIQAGHRQYSKRQGTWFRKEALLHAATTRVVAEFGGNEGMEEQIVAWLEEAGDAAV